MNELNRQLISMYAKQLRVPTFNQYGEVILQLDGNKGYDDFLVSLMRPELENRQERQPETEDPFGTVPVQQNTGGV